jgi:deoxyadenosine/deoxycytidine kinase
LAGHQTLVLQYADRAAITAAGVYRRRIIKDYQIAARYSTTRTKSSSEIKRYQNIYAAAIDEAEPATD